MRIPPFYLPFSSGLHPDHEAIDRETAAWAEQYGLGTANLRQRIATRAPSGKFAGRLLPRGKREVVRLLADYGFWLFAFDDGYCEEGEAGKHPGELVAVVSRMLGAAQARDVAALAGDPLATALRDLGSRIARHATPGQLARWVNTLREYFMAAVRESDYRAKDAIPTVDDYTILRLHSSGGLMLPVWIEMGLGIELVPLEAEHSAVRAANEMAAFVAAWDNDLISHHKESRSGDYYVNAVRVVQQERGLTAEEAVAEVVRQRDRVVMLYNRLSEDLRSWASPQLRQYLTCLDSSLRGSVEWQLASARYNPPEDPADLPTRILGTSTTAEISVPLPIPSVSWWWTIPLPHRGASRVGTVERDVTR
ncbi:terpene synthase family protein [Streptomyces sp. NPDC002431]